MARPYLTVYLNADLRKRVKILAVQKDVTVSDLIVECIEAELGAELSEVDPSPPRRVKP